MTRAETTGGEKQVTRDFLNQKAGMFKDFSNEGLQQLIDGSRVNSFEANEAISHQGAEATHFGVVLSGTVAASVLGNGSGRHIWRGLLDDGQSTARRFHR